MSIRIEDLPADIRRHLETGTTTTARPRTTKRQATGSSPYLCATCKTVYPSFNAYERHSRATPGHRRGELVLDQEDNS